MAAIFLIESSFSAKFSTLRHFRLNLVEQILWYYCGMVVFDIVQRQVVDVLYSFLLERINCDGFLEQRIAYLISLYSPIFPAFCTLSLKSFK